MSFYINGNTAGKNFAKINFVNNNDGEALSLFLGTSNPTDAGGTALGEGLSIAATGSNSSLGAGTVLFDSTKTRVQKSTWIDLRIEFYFAGVNDENARMKIYVNKSLVFDDLAHWAVGANIKSAEIIHVKPTATSNIFYDDISFTRTNKAYVAGNEYAAE